MKVIAENSHIGIDNMALAMALGTFDGVHLGHQKLIEVLKFIAVSHEIVSAVYTFDRHPLSVLCPDKAPPLLMNNQQKLAVFEQYGIDYIIFDKFDQAFANMPAEVFLEDVLFKRFTVLALIVGFDFTFGYKGMGNAELLKAEGQKRGIDVIVVPPVKLKGHIVSSSLIRRLLADGLVEQAADYLGRPFALAGVVGQGHGVGRRLGFPTANLIIEPGIIVPRRGVYATAAVIEGVDGVWPAVTNIGYRPTFNDTHVSIETHILDYSADLYGKALEIRFISRLRDEMFFTDTQKLIQQIQKDIEEARVQG